MYFNVWDNNSRIGRSRKTVAYPRAALIGNPSDGYNGKTISFTFSNFQTDITLYQSPELEIIPARRDETRFDSLKDLADSVTSFGYYGGIRLIKATLKKFYEYCEKNKIKRDDRNFSIRYHTSIPAHLGLAGSSSIIIACIRALSSFYSITIPNPILANLALSVEIDELGIGGGLQDRVAQSFQGLVYMDFAQEHFDHQGFGRYISLKPNKMPNLYIAFKKEFSEGSEILHNNLRYRYDKKEPDVINAMETFANLAEKIFELFNKGSYDSLPELMNRNFLSETQTC
ncbi:MAG: hypothetical protein JW904_00950 [Spirochaetales bacterium]|nr:hypothetical protein [Spirochaetales bacterium]